MREEKMKLVRYTLYFNSEESPYIIKTHEIPIRRITRNGRISFENWNKLNSPYISKKTFDQGLLLKDVLNFTFRESEASSKSEPIYELYCFNEQRHFGWKILNRRFHKLITKFEKKNKEENKNEDQKCSD
jgi:hypothetical protein